MPQGMFSIGGIASGLDTSDIVSQLMKLERQPVVRLEQRQAELQTTKDAWGQLTTRLSSLRTATDQLRRADRFADLTKVTASDPDAVAVSRGSGRVDASQLSFTVHQLATRQQQSSTDVFEGRDAAIGARTLTISGDDGPGIDLTAGLGPDATLDDLVAAINEAGLGVRADALQVSAGRFQLVLTADATGTAGAFEVSGAGWTDPIDVTQAAQDAHLKVGGIDVFRSSNTIDDLVEGATITLQRTTDTPVTVSAQRDIDGAVKAVTGFVEELNKTISTIGELTSYDPESRRAGPLQGQFAASQLAFNLRSAITAPIAGKGGIDALASTIGISVDRNGAVQVDEAKLRQAFTNDFEGTAARFARTGSSTDTDVAAQVSGTRTTEAGIYGAEVTRAATIARVTGAAYAPPGEGQPKTFMVRSPSGSLVAVEVDTSAQTAAQAAQRIQSALDRAGVTGLVAGVEELEGGGQAVRLSSTGYGSNTTFEVYEVDNLEDRNRIDGGTVFGLESAPGAPHAGTNVEGTIDGQVATGSGRTLTAVSGPAEGLSVFTTGGLTIPDGEPRRFDVSFWHGIGGAMDSQLRQAEGSGGSIARARSSIDSQIAIYQSRIEAFEQRLESREVTLRRQFVAMEMAMDRFNSQGQWLQGQLSQLSALNAQKQ